MSCDANIFFSIDGHNLTVIEADSTNLRPTTVDSIQIYAGQRYSVILDTRGKTAGNYWMRTLPNRAVAQDYKGNVNVAILRYKGAPLVEPSPAADVNIPVLNNTLVEGNLEPLVDKPVPGVHELGKADVSYTLRTDYNVTGNGLFNIGPADHPNDTFTPSAIPILLQVLSGAREAKDILPGGVVYTLPPNKVIEVTLPGTLREKGGPHPFHLHGHDFWVVQSAESATPRWNNTIMRDTVNAGLEYAPSDNKRNESTTIRFVTDNPGPWFLHCHIDWHLDMGLGVVFAEDTKGTKPANDENISKEWRDLCPLYNDWKDAGNED